MLDLAVEPSVNIEGKQDDYNQEPLLQTDTPITVTNTVPLTYHYFNQPRRRPEKSKIRLHKKLTFYNTNRLWMNGIFLITAFFRVLTDTTTKTMLFTIAGLVIVTLLSIILIYSLCLTRKNLSRERFLPKIMLSFIIMSCFGCIIFFSIQLTLIITQRLSLYPIPLSILLMSTLLFAISSTYLKIYTHTITSNLQRIYKQKIKPLNQDRQKCIQKCVVFYSSFLSLLLMTGVVFSWHTHTTNLTTITTIGLYMALISTFVMTCGCLAEASDYTDGFSNNSSSRNTAMP